MPTRQASCFLGADLAAMQCNTITALLLRQHHWQSRVNHTMDMFGSLLLMNAALVSYILFMPWSCDK